MTPVLAHLGGVPIEESLIYLVPPLAVVAWIYVLGRRERRNPRAAPTDTADGELLDQSQRSSAKGGEDTPPEPHKC